jgi:hypothetical protein
VEHASKLHSDHVEIGEYQMTKLLPRSTYVLRPIEGSNN